MSDVIFPTDITNGTPASDDRILLSDTSDSGAAFDAPVSELPVSTATQTALNAKESTANKGIANGYAPLDATGKVPAANLPASSGGIASGADENFVTDAEKIVLLNTSGTNTGDQDLSALATKSELSGYALNCDNQSAITDYTFTGSERRNSGYLVTTESNRTVNIDADLFSTGYEVTICKGTNNANTATLDAQAGNNINGSQTFVLTQYNETVTLIKDGANTWKVKSHYYPISGTNTGDQISSTVTYDNATSGLSAMNVKTALDELAAEKIQEPPTASPGYVLTWNGT